MLQVQPLNKKEEEPLLIRPFPCAEGFSQGPGGGGHSALAQPGGSAPHFAVNFGHLG